MGIHHPLGGSPRLKNRQNLASFTDVRELRAAGVPFVREADETATGPAGCIAVDPDASFVTRMCDSGLKCLNTDLFVPR